MGLGFLSGIAPEMYFKFFGRFFYLKYLTGGETFQIYMVHC
jgi:hypothetical protein